MPRRDGTGPWGAGPMTGRGRGWCAGVHAPRDWAGPGFEFRYRRGWRRGFGRWCGWSWGWGWEFLPMMDEEIAKKMLQHQKAILKWHLELINRQLEKIEDSQQEKAEEN